MRSTDNRYTIRMGSDGNLTESDSDGKPLWSTSAGVPCARATMQRDGNLVLYTATGEPVWASGTGGRPDGAYVLTLQTGNNIVIYAPDGKPIWDKSASTAS
ncbi:hypothetical protein R8Z50_19045 [Longispora sp. K20-0274]|uniref:hypothetical protein n=1 Tax=Longispora sp. K20-0274 TaxID=3088255 RepID=UPI0039996F9D